MTITDPTPSHPTSDVAPATSPWRLVPVAFAFVAIGGVLAVAGAVVWFTTARHPAARKV